MATSRLWNIRKNSGTENRSITGLARTKLLTDLYIGSNGFDRILDVLTKKAVAMWGIRLTSGKFRRPLRTMSTRWSQTCFSAARALLAAFIELYILFRATRPMVLTWSSLQLRLAKAKARPPLSTSIRCLSTNDPGEQSWISNGKKNLGSYRLSSSITSKAVGNSRADVSIFSDWIKVSTSDILVAFVVVVAVLLFEVTEYFEMAA